MHTHKQEKKNNTKIGQKQYITLASFRCRALLLLLHLIIVIIIWHYSSFNRYRDADTHHHNARTTQIYEYKAD